jgi:hypothetical protein
MREMVDNTERNTYAFAAIEEHIPRVDSDTMTKRAKSQ